MIPCPTWPRALVVAVVLVLLVATPGSAHPSVRGGVLPVDSRATLTLVTGHGCSPEHGGPEAPTTAVVLEVPDWLRVVEVPAAAPWKIAVDPGEPAAGTAGTVTWATDEPAVTAPDLDLAVVVSGTDGETRYLRVVQRCGELTERWVGTPDEPADQPAVEVRLVAADPDAPPPPDPAPDAAPEASSGASDDAAAAPGGNPLDDEPGEDGAGDDAPAEDAPADDPTDLAATPGDAGDEPAGWWLGLLLVFAVVPLAIVLGRRRVHADAARMEAASPGPDAGDRP